MSRQHLLREILIGGSQGYIRGSEYCRMGHPDRFADLISATCVRKALEQNPGAKVAIEAGVKSKDGISKVFIFGELTGAKLDYRRIVQDCAEHIGYVGAHLDFDPKNFVLEVFVSEQSEHIGRGVWTQEVRKTKAGDQGLMFGHAQKGDTIIGDLGTDLMPPSYHLSRALCNRADELMRSGDLPWLLPDGKGLVNCLIDANGQTLRVERVTFSNQYNADLVPAARGKEPIEVVKDAILEMIIRPVLGKHTPSKENRYINPTGAFGIGGPLGDGGLTGRKIIVDTYGGWGGHGGGAFAGKDPSKVDLVGAMIARYIAKAIVAAGLATHCTVEITYAIGRYYPLSVRINLHGTGTGYSEADITRAVILSGLFPLTAGEAIEDFRVREYDLRECIRKGYFGPDAHPWEQLGDKPKLLIQALQAL